MPSAQTFSPLLVATQAQLDAVLPDLLAAPVLGVDTESNSLFAYHERVCLIQFSTATRDYIVDPLQLDALAPLFPIFADPGQQKIFHAAEYDIICLRRDYGFEFANLFDTMVAARILGQAQLGLAALLEKHFGVTMNKKYQRANWGQRPLTKEQMDYACLDTHYLLELHQILAAELQRAGCTEEAQEEFARLEQLAPSHGQTTSGWWRVNGARDLSPRQASVLRELFTYREQVAERLNQPSFKVMGDQTLLALVWRAPQALADLGSVPGMTPNQIQRHGRQLLQAVQKGQQAPPSYPPAFEREADDVRERYDRLHQWRKQRAKNRGVESDVIMPREVLWELARQVPRSPDDLQQIEHLGPWRRKTYGAELLRVLHGN